MIVLLAFTSALLTSFGIAPLSAAADNVFGAGAPEPQREMLSCCALTDAHATSSDAPEQTLPPASESAEEADALGLDAEELGLAMGEAWLGSARVRWLRFQAQLPLSSVDFSPQPRPVERA